MKYFFAVSKKGCYIGEGCYSSFTEFFMSSSDDMKNLDAAIEAASREEEKYWKTQDPSLEGARKAVAEALKRFGVEKVVIGFADWEGVEREEVSIYIRRVV